ncbi:MAG: hypothetical protein IT317_24110 [Anaerolineales bacterium]|nr:hypothetical protein [Anaerolineales bacterium]
MTSDRDFDLLSAYVDNQLPTADKAALEARLTVEPELRTTLRELRLTVRALRALPPVAVPRSFTLTPEQVGGPAKGAALRVAKSAGPPRRALTPTLRLAAAFSALTLAVVVFADLRGGAFLAASPVEDAAGQAAVETTLPAEAPLPAPTTTAAAEVQIMEMTAEEATATTGPTVAGDAAAVELTPATAAGLMPEPTGTPDAERVAATSTADDTESAKHAGLAPSATPLSVAVVSPTATAPASDQYYADGEASSDRPPAPGLPPVRALEIGLALLTGLLGLGAWLARRAP